ncbi:hypothetical protein HJC23_007906 [Cyclotella cryptica]|uniref:Uncharacterized protein n=1 Tax=Cyclotella cryptica TaxID=29204 RepID=A0ABD3R026_9STRA|eukprot:CCRYP_000261-RA/>CCRYP_000261-RA protein AED:0.00 eAED:0.00 QI:373/-1/1/1/-1/1/1/50/1332
MMMEPPLDYYSYRDRRPSPDPPKPTRRKSKSFHFEEANFSGTTRRADVNNRRGSMDNPRRPKITSFHDDDGGGSFKRSERTGDSFDRRRRRDREYLRNGNSNSNNSSYNNNNNSNNNNSNNNNNSPPRDEHKRSYNANLDYNDRGASLERRSRDDYSYSRRDEPWNSQEQVQQQQQQLQQRRQLKTVIHACDDKTGKCLFHPHIVLRKKAIFGVLGGWVDVLRSCPECEEEDLRRLNSASGGFVDSNSGSGPLVSAGGGGSGAGRDRQSAQQPPTGAARRPRRRTLSPLNDKRDRTLSPQDRNNGRRDYYGESRNANAPSSQQQRRDRTLSPVDRTRRGMEAAPSQPYQQQPQNYRGTKQPILPKRGVPRPRSRTLSPIDQSRRRLGAFGKGKSRKGNYSYDSDSNESNASDSEHEEQDQKRRPPSHRGRNGSWRTKVGNNNNNSSSKVDRKGYDYNDDNTYDDGGRVKKEKRKKNKVRTKAKESDDNHTEDYISSYIVSGAVPGADTHRSTKNSKRRSMGGLNTSGNSSVGEWNLSDYAERGKKLAEKVMRKGKKKAKEGKNRTVAEDGLSDDERLDYLYNDYAGNDYEKSRPYSPKQRNNKQRPLDLSDKTQNASNDIVYPDEKYTPQSWRRKMEQPQPRDVPSFDDKYSKYEKSWSADGIRVHATNSNDKKEGDIEDQYAKALSLDGGIRIITRGELEVESSEFAWRQKQKYEHFVNDGGEVFDANGRNNSHSSNNQEDSSKASLNDNREKQTQFRQREVDRSHDNESRPQTEPSPPAPETLKGLSTSEGADNPLSASSDKFNSQDIEPSVPAIDKLLESIMHEYIDRQSSDPSGPIGDESSEDESSEASSSHRESTIPHAEEPNPINDGIHAKEEDIPLRDTNEKEAKLTEPNPEERPDQPEIKQPLPFPFPTKQECLPRVRSIGNLTIDLTALQATRPSKVEAKTVDVKPAVTVTSNVAPNDLSESESEESIKIDRAALQHPRRRDKTSDEKVKTFETSNLPWTGRFGESGMYTGLVNEQYQPHGKGTMLFDTGDVKKGHWKNGDFVRECGAFSDSENDDDDDDDDAGEGDLSSSMMDLNLSMASKYGRDRSRSRSKDCGEAPPPTPPPSYQIGEIAKHRDMIHESAEIQELVPKLKVDDGAFIRRSDGKWTYAVVKILETNDGKRAIRFTVNERNSSKSYVEKYWFTHIRPMKVVEQQQPPSDTASLGEREGRPKRRDPAGMISRQSSMTSLSSTTSEKEEEPTNRGISCPPTQNRLFGGRSRSRSRRRAVSFSPMRTLCSISESDMEDNDSDDDDNDSFAGNGKLEVTGLHTMARSRYTLRGIDP